MRKSRNKMMSLMMAAAVSVTSVPAYHVLAADTTTEAQEYAVTMKIPYHDFYEIYGVDTLKNVTSADYIDAFSSATVTKATGNGFGGLNAGTYHVPDIASTDTEAIQALRAEGKTVNVEGVQIPVVVTAKERAALIEAGAYAEADFTALTNGSYTKKEISSSRNSAGKELDVTYTPVLQAEILDASKLASSGAISSASVKITKLNDAVEKVSAGTTLSVGGHWGDYELDLSGDLFDNTLTKDNSIVYGVIVNTVEGDQYAMYSQENIWNISEIAWSVSDSNRSEAYEKTMGQTVTGFTYITSKGVYDVDIADTYLPVLSNITAKAEDPTVAAETVVNVTLKDAPADFVPAYSLAETNATITATVATANGYAVTIANAVPGTYTLNVTDSSGKYEGTSTTFTVKGSKVSYNNGLTMEAQGADSIANYIKNITSVSVSTGAAVTYLPVSSGTKNHLVSKDIFNADGMVNEKAVYDSVEAAVSGRKVTYNVVSNGNVFPEDTTYTITVSSTGYEDVSFTYTKGVQAPATQAPTTQTPATQVPVPATNGAVTATSSAVTTEETDNKSNSTSKKKISVLKLTKYKASTKKIKGKTVKTATVVVKTGGKKYTVKANKTGVFTVTLKKKLKKGNKISVTVKKTGYTTKTKSFKVK